MIIYNPAFIRSRCTGSRFGRLNIAMSPIQAPQWLNRVERTCRGFEAGSVLARICDDAQTGPSSVCAAPDH